MSKINGIKGVWNKLESKNKEEINNYIDKFEQFSDTYKEVLKTYKFNNTEEFDDFITHNCYKLDKEEIFSKFGTRVFNWVKKCKKVNTDIYVLTDYDMDGIGCAVLFKRFFPEAQVFFPDREKEGYGLTEAFINRFLNEIKQEEYLYKLEANKDGYNHKRLVFITDCGTNSASLIQKLVDMKLTPFVIDHHEFNGKEQPACAILNPKINYQGTNLCDLCATGLVYELLRHYGKKSKDKMECNLDIVALATIADMCPLAGPNRYYVNKGMGELRNTSGLQAIMENSGINDLSHATAEQLAFFLIPKINACGRIDDPYKALNLFTANSYYEAKALARPIDEINNTRKEMAYEATIEAENMLFDNIQKGYVLAKDEWHSGILGNICAKMCEKYQKPFIILGRAINTSNSDDDIFTGSCRSANKINLIEFLTANQELLETYGGHKDAAGIKIKRKYIKKLQEKLDDYCSCDDNILEEQPLYYHSEITSTDQLEALAEDLTRGGAEPFGMGNPTPKFLIKNVEVDGVLQSGNHKQYSIIKTAYGRIFCFTSNDDLYGIKPGAYVDLIVTISLRVFNGIKSASLTMVDYEIKEDPAKKVAKMFTKKRK